MTLQAWCQTDVGLRRDNNQDSFLIDESLGLFLVADGMGGHRGGEVASKLAVETVRDVVQQSLRESGARKPNPRALMSKAYEAACARIYDESQKPGSDLQGMGTTLVAAFMLGDTLYVGNVGDSRAYLFTKDQLWQITEDHSLVNEQLRAGLLKESDVDKFAAKNVITRSVGFEREVQVDIIERTMQPGDMVLICSDGLSGMVTDAKIAEILRATPTKDIVAKCITEAKANGGDDNVTTLVIYAKPQ
jgi:serine/threonine protein phosphatase PrpC